MSAIFVSFFNSDNVGDKLISSMLSNDISSKGYNITKCSYEGNFNITNEAPKSIISKLKNKIFKGNFWREFEREIQKHNTLIIGGGNMIMDYTYHSDSANHFNKYIEIAKKHNKKVMVISIGVGPFNTVTQRNNTKKSLSKANYVTFRDEKSYQLVSDNTQKQFISIDPVFRLDRFESDESEESIIAIGIINPILFNASEDQSTKIISSYITLIHKLLKMNKKIILFTTEIKDEKVMNQIYSNLAYNSERVSKFSIRDVDEVQEFYSKNISVIIAARMHALIIGFTQEIPIIGLSWQEKVESFFNIINEQESYFDINSMDLTISNIITMVIKYENSLETKQKYRTTKKELKNKYDINFKILELMRQN